MAKRYVRTTQERTIDDLGRPVATSEERQVVRTIREPEGAEVYDPSSALPERYRTKDLAVSEPNGLAEIARRVRAQESWARTESGVLRDLDHRLIHLEDANRSWTAMQSIEQTTWWALWGILMLLLGATIAVVLILLITSTVR